MKFLRNTGTERILDAVRPALRVVGHAVGALLP